MVVAYMGNDTGDGGIDHIGRIKTSAKPDFQNDGVGRLA